MKNSVLLSSTAYLYFGKDYVRKNEKLHSTKLRAWHRRHSINFYRHSTNYSSHYHHDHHHHIHDPFRVLREQFGDIHFLRSCEWGIWKLKMVSEESRILNEILKSPTGNNINSMGLWAETTYGCPPTWPSPACLAEEETVPNCPFSVHHLPGHSLVHAVPLPDHDMGVWIHPPLLPGKALSSGLARRQAQAWILFCRWLWEEKTGYEA